MTDLNHYCIVLLTVILCCGIIDCRKNNRRNNKARKCKEIKTIYGGDVVYFGDRSIDTEVYYSCDDDYTLKPGDVDHSICRRKGNKAVWIPAPPMCLEMANVEVPVNGFTDTNLDVIEDGESYNVFCNEGYELYRGGFKNMDSINVTNYNGTLRPKVPSCKPARCDPLALNETIVSYTNGTEVTDLVESGTSILHSCIPDYVFRNENFGASVPGRCKFGKFMRVPDCIPKPCTIGNLTLNSFTNIQYFQDTYTLLFPGLEINHNSIIEITCRNHYQYELYVQSTQTFVEEFLTVCSYGDFDKTNAQFPVCLEKRCHFTESSEYCFWKNGTSRDTCYQGDFYVPSRTTLNIRCSDGYKQASGTNETRPSTKCLYGEYSAWKSFDCVPLPCTVPQVRNAESTIRKSEVESSTNVTFKCNNGYHFTEERNTNIIESMCHLGDWIPTIPHHCEPDSCPVSVKNNTKYTVRKSSHNHTSVTSSGLLPHGTDLVVACPENFDMIDVNGNPLAEKASKISNCAFGKWSNDAIAEVVCRKRCGVVNITHGSLVNASENFARESIQHGEKVTFKCKTGYHFTEEPNTNIIESMCHLGDWIPTIPHHCEPDSCPISVMNNTKYTVRKSSHNHTSVPSSGLLPHGTDIVVACPEDFDMFDTNGNPLATNASEVATCTFGKWSNDAIVQTVCRKRCGVVNITHGRLVKPTENLKRDSIQHGEKVTFKCKNGYHFKEEPNTNIMESMCNLGDWIPTIPRHCEPDSCPISVKNNTKYTIRETSHNYTSVTSSGLLPHGTDLVVACAEDFDMFDANGNPLAKNASEVATCAFGKWSNDAISQITCRKHCVIPDDPRYHFTADGGKVVTSRDLVGDGWNLTVSCTNNEYTRYDYYYDDNFMLFSNVTCINGRLTDIDIICDDVKPDECLQLGLENGNVSVAVSGTYHVLCNAGYTLNVNTQLDCVCEDGKLSCSNQVPACLPDGCPISLVNDVHKLSVKMDGVDMTDGTTVPHDNEAVFDCEQTNGDVFEPNNRTFLCKAGRWLANDLSWDHDNNGEYPECTRLARGCTISHWPNNTNMNVKNSEGKSLQRNSTIDNDDHIVVDCGMKMLGEGQNFTYICKDGVLKLLHNGTLQHGPGNMTNCAVIAGNNVIQYFQSMTEDVWRAFVSSFNRVLDTS